jgi:hypothetical protein
MGAWAAIAINGTGRPPRLLVAQALRVVLLLGKPDLDARSKRHRAALLNDLRRQLTAPAVD